MIYMSLENQAMSSLGAWIAAANFFFRNGLNEEEICRRDWMSYLSQKTRNFLRSGHSPLCLLSRPWKNNPRCSSKELTFHGSSVISKANLHLEGSCDLADCIICSPRQCISWYPGSIYASQISLLIAEYGKASPWIYWNPTASWLKYSSPQSKDFQRDLNGPFPLSFAILCHVWNNYRFLLQMFLC